MSTKGILILVVVALVGAVVWYGSQQSPVPPPTPEVNQEGEEAKTPVAAKPATPETITLSGTYVCLPFLPDVPPTADCAFGIKTDDGEYYAVNFGAGAGSMADFRDGERITARGMLILRDNLRPNSWTKFEMKGLFTVLEKQ